MDTAYFFLSAVLSMKVLFSKKEKLQEDEMYFSLAPRDDVDEKKYILIFLCKRLSITV